MPPKQLRLRRVFLELREQKGRPPLTATIELQDSPSGADERLVKPALIKGWHRRCPNCGSGPMMKGYLKVRDTCPVCDEALHHQRADDGPAYLTILIVGHILGPLMLWGFVEFRPDPWVLVAVFSVASVAMSLYLLPRLKGAMIGFQWAKRMHGFGRTE